ncbi:hypothetical protein [Pseudorhodobacter sp.]|uniref:hypothetical protein n=1 Tax=Pseudorhodobacter sp. TaxID=1934400 RepID=UPI0026481824|nr:hypothetical protein [Pseudorhodobacter sp.]MDN5788649.1 hypothetical protein [Pseudorhodobacter sp.]
MTIEINETNAIPTWEAEFEAILKEGATLAVKCLSDPYQNGQIWSGEWVAYALPGDGRTLVLALRRDNKPKIIKRANGLVSLATRLGFDVVPMPSSKGAIASGKVSAKV